MGERLRSRPVALLGLLIAAGALVPVMAQPAVACLGGHGQAFLSGFAGGTPPTNIPTIFYAGAEGGTATARVSPTLSCTDAQPAEIGRVQATYATDSNSPATAAANSDYEPESGTTQVICASVHEGATTQCETDPDFDAIPITIGNDETIESVEWFQFRLTSAQAVGGNGVGGVGFPSQARVYVVDADGSSRPALEPGYESRTTDRFESGRVRIPVFRAGPLTNVSFAVTGSGTVPATNGVDFTCMPSCAGSGGTGTLMNSDFDEAGQRLGFIQVNMLSDGAQEGDEFLRVSVTGAAPADDEFTTVRIRGSGADTSDPVSRFHHPKDGLKYKRGDIRIREMHSITSDIGIAGLATVQIAVRQNLMNGSCRWWNGGIFAAGPCATKRWLDMSFVGNWNPQGTLLIYGRNFPALTPSVKTQVRNYTAWTRATDTAGNDESVFQRGRNYSIFEVLRKRN